MIRYSQVDVQDFLVSLGSRNVHQATASEMCFSCPFGGHMGGDENPSAYMNLETTVWFCHGCKRKGNCVSFLADLENISPMLATRFIKERYDSTFKEPNGSLLQEVEKLWTRHPVAANQGPIPLRFLDDFVTDWHDDTPWAKYMLEERHFEPDVLDYFQCGFDPVSERVTLAVFTPEDDLMGFKGRSFKHSKAKYMVIGDSPRSNYQTYGFRYYSVSHAVFGLNLAEKNGSLIVCEGELNVIALHQKGFYNAVAMSGSNLSETQRRALCKYAEEVTIFFDSDPAGHRGAALAAKQLQPYIRVKLVPDHEGDPAIMSKEEIANCLQNAESSLALSLPLAKENHESKRI